jgi:chromosome segregation ATPase
MSERSFWRGSVSFDESLPVFDKKPDEIETLRSRVAELESSALGGYEDGWHKLRSERDTLKARVSGLEAKLKYRHRKLAAVKQRAEAAEAEVERITAIIKREADLHNERQIRLEAAEAKLERVRGLPEYNWSITGMVPAYTGGTRFVRADELQAELDKVTPAA